MKKLRDRVAVVTGAASGIGRATSVALAREGCDLAIADVDEVGLAETAAQVRALGRRACAHRVDVSDKQRMQRYADEVIAEYGQVHVLVNNAGVTIAADFEQHTLEDWEWIVGINFWGVVYGCKFFLPYLKQADEAHIVNLSSVFGIVGVPSQTSYCATKFAVRGFSEALWVELKSHNIGVTAVHPAGVRTNIARSARTASDQLKRSAIAIIEKNSVTPERCAQLIVSAIKKNKMRQLVTRESYLLDWAKRVAPGLPERVMQSGYSRGLLMGGGPTKLRNGSK
jgi:NAD(P)-dependent dehydrogenase (short-subunit alcohol dehydrogenase family)